jgi:pyruvate dehydrogenase (quinone)
MIGEAKNVATFGGDGCRDARDEVIALATALKAPVGYSFRGKQWLEHDNPNAVGMTGLLGYGGAYRAIRDADLLLLLGTDFPFSEFLPGDGVKKVQIDRNAKHIGRRTPVDLGVVGDVRATLEYLLPKVPVNREQLGIWGPNRGSLPLCRLARRLAGTDIDSYSRTNNDAGSTHHSLRTEAGA